MLRPDARRQQVMYSGATAFLLALICPLATPQARNSSTQTSPTVQFVYYRAANIPFGSDAPVHKNIYSVSSEYADEKQLTNDGHSFNPVLSPDGTRVVYLHITSDTCENCLVPPQYEINVMNVDGTDPHTLTSIDRPVLLSWSPDGRSLAYGAAALVIRQTGFGLVQSLGLPDSDIITEMARLDSTASSLYLMHLDLDGPARLLAENATGLFNRLEWSPDGKWIAYGCHTPQKANPGSFHICLLGTGVQAKPIVLTEGAVFLEHYSWSPDGAQIVYSTFDLEADKLRKDPYKLWVVRTDGSAPRLLTTTKNGLGTPQWSRDGKTIVFCDRERNKSFVTAINVDGTNKVRLTDPKLNASDPVWSVDGKLIAFTAFVHGKLQVHLMSADGSQLRALTHDSRLACSNFTWVGSTHLLLLRCGQMIAPLGPGFGNFVDGGYYLLSADDPVGPRRLGRQGAMAISFARNAVSSAGETSTP